MNPVVAIKPFGRLRDEALASLGDALQRVTVRIGQQAASGVAGRLPGLLFCQLESAQHEASMVMQEARRYPWC